MELLDLFGAGLVPPASCQVAQDAAHPGGVLRRQPSSQPLQRRRRLARTRAAEGRGWLLSWPRPRFFKLESQHARASFDVAFLTVNGGILEMRTLAQGHPEGLMPESESAHALFLGVGELKKLGAAKGDVVDLSGAFLAGAPQDLPAMKVGDQSIRVELAISEPEKQHGLMFRPRMSAEEGMLFVYREEYYLKNKEPKPGTIEYETWQREMEQVHGLAEVIIGKQRHGPTGTVRLHFEDSLTRFSNLANEGDLPVAYD